MPINTDLNVAPFFDDYDANNQYYRILFRPGTALQARELTQIQSILQNQVESFGNWAFKNGDIVTGCPITDQPVIPYIRLADRQTNGYSITPANLANTRIVSASSNLQARVILGNPGLVGNYPNTNILYIQYLNTGTANQQIFSPNETLNIYTIPSNGSIIATVNTYSNTGNSTTYATGNAHGIAVGEGVVYLNGTFVKVLNPTYGIVNAYGTSAGNNFVGFQLLETVVTENQDPSLLDNALGYPNENAPGSYRLKLVPTLISLDQTVAANTDGFNPIAQYSFGKLVSKDVAQTDFHSIVDDAISQRIYEEAGNYVVNPFVVDTISNAAAPDAANAANGSSDATKVLARVNPGIGYTQGHRVELINTRYAPVRRGNDTVSFKSQQITFNYGSYFVLNEVSGSFNFITAQTVDLYNTVQTSITSRTFGQLSVAGTKIGTAQVRCFTYNSGIPGLKDAQYLLHVFNVQMIAGYNVNQVQSVYLNGTPKAVGDVVGTLNSAATKDQLYSVGQTGLKNLRDSANNNNTQYVYRSQNTSATMLSNGYISVTIPASATGGTDILSYGNTGTATLGSGDGSSFAVIALANNQSAALTGTVNVSTSSNVVTASSPILTTTFYQGDQVLVGTEIRTVISVSNSTSMVVDAPWSVANTVASYYKFIKAGKIIPVYQTGSTGGVYIINSTSFAVATNLALASSSAVAVTYDTLRTSAIPAQKVIKKNRFVKIQANTNPAGPQGPYCLGVADVHQVRAVYGSADGSYTTSGVNLSSSFAWDHGQKDTHYDYGKIIPTGGYSPSTYPYLLVQLDYFVPNTTPGSGFFTVESYAIDDSNAANNTAIQTKDIPLYVDEGGVQRWLRDYVDFRIPAVNVAADTGTIDSSNATQVTTAIAAATVNPSNTLTLSVGSNLMTPAYGKNMQNDFTIYLPRKDLVMITPDTTLKIKEGLSTAAPQTPLSPDNAMTLAVLNIPPYPSLTTDQVDSNRLNNQRSINMVRDTSTAITINLVMNRRYTMKDIGKLDNRIGNLEYYAALSLLEQKAKSTSVTDQNGLNRFKNGIFVDPFTDFTNSDVTNPEYSIAIDQNNGLARPKFITETIKLDFNSGTSTNIQKTSRLLTLPYTSNTLISQPYATKYRSSAHVASAWNGTLVLAPAYSNHIDTNNTASVGITIDNATPWQQFANSPMGSTWGNWQTSSNVTSYSVQTGTQDILQVELGYQYVQSTAQQAIDAAIGQYQAQGYQIGGTSTTFTGGHGGIGSNASITKIN